MGGRRQGFTRREALWRGARLAGAVGLAPPLLLGNGCRRPAQDRRPNVLLVTLDTTRATNLGCYGHGRNTSPNLDRLAEDALLYSRMTATSSWTLPSHASIFTGKLPTSHGARFDPGGPLVLEEAGKAGEGEARYRARGIGRSESTLAGILTAAGLRTGAIVAGPWMRRAFGLDRGFEHYDDDEIGPPSGRLAAQVTARALAWIASVADQPFFLFLNYYDPHWPYAPPGRFATSFGAEGADARRSPDRATRSRALYDAEILTMDHHFGRVLEHLENLGLYDRTLIVVTADHGELLGEHGAFGHGSYLFEEELHIPLIVRYPDHERRPAAIDHRICQTDLLPLILDRLEIQIPEGTQGDPPPEIRHPIVAETYPLEDFSPHGHWRAVYRGDFKFLWNSQNRHRLFNLRDDPGETRNLLPTEMDRARTMGQQLGRYLASLPRPSEAPEATVDPATREALRELGYLEESAPLESVPAPPK